MLTKQERLAEAEFQLEAARSGFEALLGKQLLAFADHAAEFYSGSGNDCHARARTRAHQCRNRPTRRAVRQLQAIAADIQEKSHDQS